MDKTHILELNQAGLLAEVLGFETDEVAGQTEGSNVTTLSGREFIDFTGGIAVHACGHCHPAIVAAIQEQAAQVLHTSDTMRHAPQLELADFLRGKLADAGVENAAFVFMNSGSESNDAAAKLALKVTGRKKLVAFVGAFHGRTMLCSALSRSKSLHWQSLEPFLTPLRQHILHAPAPRCAGCTMDSPSCCSVGLEALFTTHGDDIAAVFFEAQQGEGGYVPRTPESGRRLRELCDQYGALLIADEIQAGMGRTGRWFAFEHLGVVPDIVVFGKAVGGGMPLAGIAARAELLARWTPGEHGTTFGGNPVSCAAGLAAVRLMEREGLVARAARLGAEVKARLGKRVGTHGVVDVRGNGFMLGIELRTPDGAPDYARLERVKDACRERDLLVLTCGAKLGDPHADCAVIRLIPPLNTPEDVLWAGIAVVESVLAGVE
ncbi:aspartate aminotransferase family protein [Armatimonas rosea]|uniref:4-aminobutyrate aminotransferase-like enzyme n=1 Tax=Armatimonas rosea TaxID=685828 RepID=A0A7W9SLS2_ARMRO|nr:aspartate aminotransferase family protein [Armatimonas rosea]MBB6048981.1 4-aminobutyrate aminotransferase-like enzyme [Armatimonas rosea]